MPTADELRYGPNLKLQRAAHHIHDLSARCSSFLAEQPFKLLRHDRRRAGETVFRIKAEKPIPAELSLVIGDIVHNMRAALDLTIFPMAAPRADKPGRIMFPMAKDDTPTALADAIKDGRAKFAGKKVLEQIELLRPYPAGNPILWGIDALDKRDKHQVLVLTHSHPAFTPGNEKELELLLGKNPKGVTVVLASPEGQTALTLRHQFATRDLPDRGEQEAKHQPPFFIAFGEGHPFAHLPVIDQLLKGHHEARRAVDALIAAFLDPTNTFPDP
jgi:hypothetical protein